MRGIWDDTISALDRVITIRPMAYRKDNGHREAYERNSPDNWTKI